jgi:hypothetical protein
MTGTRVEAWRVHDTGLVAVPTRFRRLGGLVRHLQGRGDAWPDQVVLELVDGVLSVSARDGTPVGAWEVGEVTVQRLGDGPPVQFVLEVPGASHLLAASSAGPTDALLAAL